MLPMQIVWRTRCALSAVAAATVLRLLKDVFSSCHRCMLPLLLRMQALVRRRAKVADRDGIVQCRVPPAPIPLAWGRTVRPYVPPALLGQKEMAGEGPQAGAESSECA